MFCCHYVAVESLCIVAEKPKFKKKAEVFLSFETCHIFSHNFLPCWTRGIY